MKPIQTSLNKWMNENEDFKSRHLKLKQEVLSHPDISLFLKNHPEITDEEIDKRLNKLYEFTTQSVQCADCASFNSCKNILQGYSPILRFENDEIHVAYEKCENRIKYESMQQEQKLIQSLYMPKEIMNASMDNLHKTDNRRLEAILATEAFIDTATRSLPKKGFFFSGPFGVGKTYLLGAIANRLQDLNISSTLIYMPEFVREIREAIKDQSVEEKVDVFKHADVLMLDDIGAETQSAWFRDDILGSILQYRMMEQLPVFFTSNYTMKQLEERLAETTKGGIEKVKAGRIMERVKQVSTEVSMSGDNYRDK